MKLIVDAVPFDDFAFTNCLYKSLDSICKFKFVKIKNFVYETCEIDEKDKNKILIPGKIRNLLSCTLREEIEVKKFEEIKSYIVS